MQATAPRAKARSRRRSRSTARSARPGTSRRARRSSPLLPSVIFVRRTLAAVRLLARDGGLPRWLRGLAAVGLAPIPGPFDEAVLVVVAAILWLGYRDRLRAAWREAEAPSASR